MKHTNLSLVRVLFCCFFLVASSGAYSCVQFSFCFLLLEISIFFILHSAMSSRSCYNSRINLYALIQEGTLYKFHSAGCMNHLLTTF